MKAVQKVVFKIPGGVVAEWTDQYKIDVDGEGDFRNILRRGSWVIRDPKTYACAGIE